jgi:Fe-S cluster biogenesis protein NfuA
MENHPLYARIQSALDSIRPYLIADGGNVEIVGISEENELTLSLVGN